MQESSTDDDIKDKKKWSDIGSPESAAKPIKIKELLSFMSMSTTNLTGSNANDTPNNSDAESSDEKDTRSRKTSDTTSVDSVERYNANSSSPNEFSFSSPTNKKKNLILPKVDSAGKVLPKPITRKKSVVFDEDTAKFGKHEVIKNLPTPKKKEEVTQLLNYLNFS